MQPSIKNDIVYLLMMLESIGKVQLYSNDFNDAHSLYSANQQLNFNASLLMLENIGEQIAKISDELKNKHQQIPWKSVKNLRNRIAHDYSGIDFTLTFEIIKNDLPRFGKTLHEIIQIEIGEGNFQAEEIKIAQASLFYRHVNFSEFI